MRGIRCPTTQSQIGDNSTKNLVHHAAPLFPLSPITVLTRIFDSSTGGAPHLDGFRLDPTYLTYAEEHRNRMYSTGATSR